MRRRHAVGEVVPLRAQKGVQNVLFSGHGYPLCRRKVCRLLERAGGVGQAEERPCGGIEQPRMAGTHLNVNGPRTGVKGLRGRERLRVFDRDERVRAEVAFFGKGPRGIDKILRRAARRAVRLQQGERIGEEMRMRVREGGQDERAVQIFRPVKGRGDVREMLVLYAEFRSARKGEPAVSKKSFHADSMAASAARQTAEPLFRAELAKTLQFTVNFSLKGLKFGRKCCTMEFGNDEINQEEWYSWLKSIVTFLPKVMRRCASFSAARAPTLRR